MWEISTSDQLVTIAGALVYGVAACLVYDLLRALRKAGCNSFWEVFAGDVIYCFLAGVTFFLLSLARTGGELRGYVLASAAAGFIICRISLSRIFFPAVYFLVRSVCKTASFISDLTAGLCDAFLNLTGRVFGKIRNVSRGLKKCLKNGIKVLYNKRNLSKGRDFSDGC